MKAYQTEQKRLLLDFLRRHTATPLSIEEIAAGLQGRGAPGKSTVYRLMNQLVEQGQVRRFVRGNSRHFVYQLLACEHCNRHLHLRCERCGQLFHLDDGTSGNMQQLVAAAGFRLDPGQTTLQGLCQGCSGKERT